MRRVLSVVLLCVPCLLPAQASQRPAYEFSTLLFGNFQMRTDDAAKATTGGEPPNRFDLARAYLTFRAPAGDRASLRVTTDVFQNAAAGYYGGLAIRLKYGILQYDLTRNLAGIEGMAAAARIGMLQTVTIEHVETFWPRWLGSTALETNGFFSSSDVGAATHVALPGRRGEAYVTVMNGVGYANAENDRFKDVAGRLSFTPFANDSGFLRTFAISPWYYKGWNASQFVAPNPGQVGQVSEGLRKDRRGVFAGVRDRRLTVGAEYSQRLEELEGGQNTIVSPRVVLDRTSVLQSVFVVARPTELLGGNRSRLGVVGRFDRFTLNTGADARNELLIAGATWELNPRVTLAFDYQGLTPTGTANAGVPSRTWFFHWVASF
ncbi:MAG: hypothetical protein WD801_07150 [Gemmatimonadaceae bacterium]